jgi:hypothetical protein
MYHTNEMTKKLTEFFELQIILLNSTSNLSRSSCASHSLTDSKPSMGGDRFGH